ncbi:MAG: hypothetical protein ACR2J8_07120 [Thermomicrobiales bacterium]
MTEYPCVERTLSPAWHSRRISSDVRRWSFISPRRRRSWSSARALVKNLDESM